MLSVHRSILRGDMNIFGSSVTKGLMTGLSRVMTYDIFGGAHSQRFDTWRDEQRRTSRHQPRLPRDPIFVTDRTD